MKPKIVKLKSDETFRVKVKQTKKDRKERRVQVGVWIKLGCPRKFRTALHEWTEWDYGDEICSSAD